MPFNVTPAGDDRLSYVTIWNDPLVFVSAPFHPLAKQTQLNLEDLIAYLVFCLLHKLIRVKLRCQSLKRMV